MNGKCLNVGEFLSRIDAGWDPAAGTGTGDALRVHVEACAACRDRLAEARRFRLLLRRARPGPAAMPLLDEAARARIEAHVDALVGQVRPLARRPGAETWRWALPASMAVAASLCALWFGVTRAPEPVPGPTAEASGVDWRVPSQARPAFSVAPQSKGDPVASSPVAAASGVPALSEPVVGARRPGAASPIARPSGVVTSCVEAFVVGAEGVRRPLAAGDRVFAGQRLETGRRGALRVDVKDRFALFVGAGSVLELAALTASETLLSLERGEVESEVAPRAGGQRYAVRAGDYRAEVRGTRFVVVHRSGAETTVRTFEGAVAVVPAERRGEGADALENTFAVTTGTTFQSAAGRVTLGPTPPASLREPKTGLHAHGVTALPAGEPETPKSTVAAEARRKDAPQRGKAPKLPSVKEKVIEIPPQGMTPEDIERVKREEDRTKAAPAPAPKPQP